MTPTDVQVERLYREYGPLIHRRCRRILRDEDLAWDATHEVFARAIKNWDGFTGDSTRLTWLSRIATNHCLNEIRNRSGRRAKLEQRREEAPGAGTGPADQRTLEVLDVVRAVMQDMDPELQKLAVLYWFDEMTQAEIAQEVGLSVPTVRKRLRTFVDRARRTLRRGFESQVMRAIAADNSPLLLLIAALEVVR
jgi:RNA polymerase sigma-70 factor, ECF subfamily